MDLKYKEFYQKHKERYKGNEETLKELILHQAKEEMFLTFSKEELIFLLKNMICLLKSNLNLDVVFPIFHKVKLEEEPERIKHYATDLVMENIICYYVNGVDEIEKL